MDIESLQNKMPILIQYLQDKGYSRMYMHFINTIYAWLIEGIKEYGWVCYDEAYDAIDKIWDGKSQRKSKRTHLNVISRYDLHGEFPGGKHVGRKAKHTKPLNNEFDNLIEYAFAKLDGRVTYAKDVRKCLYDFFEDITSQGISTLEGITPSSVLHAFSSEGMKARGYHRKYAIQAGLSQCADKYGNVVLRIKAFVPCIPQRRKVIQFLTNEEVQAIKYALDNDDTISLRDKAVVTIALYTGLRCCDIVALERKNIDWNRDIICIIQSKTQAPLELPLRPVVGEAIVKYIDEERPKISSDKIFISKMAPYNELSAGALGTAARKVMAKANIRLRKQDRKGMHLFRHYVATKLFENNVSPPIITATLGHQSPATLNRYLNAELSKLKECALSLEPFPIRKDIFNI